MATDFSFGKLMRHLTTGAELPRAAHLPTEQHMREAMEGYIANIVHPTQEYADRYFTFPRTGEDPVGTAPLDIRGPEDVLAQMAALIDVPFTPRRAELTGPVTFSLGNQAAMAFTLWAEVDGHDLSIDIIEVMTFDEHGRINRQMAYWGVENVTILN